MKCGEGPKVGLINWSCSRAAYAAVVLASKRHLIQKTKESRKRKRERTVLRETQTICIKESFRFDLTVTATFTKKIDVFPHAFLFFLSFYVTLINANSLFENITSFQIMETAVQEHTIVRNDRSIGLINADEGSRKKCERWEGQREKEERVRGRERK